MRKNLLIALAVFILMCFLGIYGKLTYTPIQIPTSDVDLRLEGIMFQAWFTFTFVLSITLLFLLTAITYVFKLIKH